MRMIELSGEHVGRTVEIHTDDVQVVGVLERITHFTSPSGIDTSFALSAERGGGSLTARLNMRGSDIKSVVLR